MTELLRLNRRRLARLSLAIALILGALPFVTPVAAQEAEGDGPLTPVTLTFTTVEMSPGQEWVDADGNFHFRDEVEVDTVSGAIEGDATVTLDGDGVATGECTEESCPGMFHLTATVEITTEGGSWDGHAALIADNELGYQTVRAILVGRGDNAGKVIVLDTVTGEEEDSISFSGQMLEMARPVSGVNLSYNLCFTGPDSASGGFIAHNPIADSGSVSATFNTVGVPAPRLIVADLTFQSEHGTLNGMMLEVAHEGTSQNYGYFLLMGGTGDYAGLYGRGYTQETVSFGENGACAGPSGQWIGESFEG